MIKKLNLEIKLADTGYTIGVKDDYGNEKELYIIVEHIHPAVGLKHALIDKVCDLTEDWVEQTASKETKRD